MELTDRRHFKVTLDTPWLQGKDAGDDRSAGPDQEVCRGPGDCGREVQGGEGAGDIQVQVRVQNYLTCMMALHREQQHLAINQTGRGFDMWLKKVVKLFIQVNGLQI